jgi:hypothetical protein
MAVLFFGIWGLSTAFLVRGARAVSKVWSRVETAAKSASAIA